MFVANPSKMTSWISYLEDLRHPLSFERKQVPEKISDTISFIRRTEGPLYICSIVESELKKIHCLFENFTDFIVSDCFKSSSSNLKEFFFYIRKNEKA